MAALVHRSLKNCQVLRFPAQLTDRPPDLLARVRETLELWLRRAQERQELAQLSERELRDMRVSSADVWYETRQPFWRATRKY